MKHIKAERAGTFFTKRKNSFIKNKILNIRVLNRIIFCLISLLIVYYLGSINDLSIKGFQIVDFKKQISNFTAVNDNLELKIMSLSSYNNIIVRVNELKMVVAKEIEYLPINTVVAKK